jgi:predicted unusual protein kinase regulating ubiquinone biosynthesis (AarF/ABC1/UbiB family)
MRMKTDHLTEESSDKEYTEDGFGVRIKRYGQVGGAVAGLAARLAGEKYLGHTIIRGEHAGQLKDILGNLKGPLMKVGQILATIPEALPPEYAEAFQELQSNAPPMGSAFVRRRMKAELGNDWQDQFAGFGEDAAAAASLGQVHKATLHDGRIVACKLQYPDMKSAIETDLSQLALMFRIFESYDKTIKTKYIHQELSERLKEELDYRREARQMNLYHHILAQEEGVEVPEVIDDLSTERLLTATWLEGKQLMGYKSAPQEERNQIAMNMFRAWYVPLYEYGIIHGDPHPGNYTVREDLGINLLDFGCVRIFPPEFVGGVIDLYKALLHNDDALAVHAFETWGFSGLSKEQVDTLKIWAGFLYGPILEDKIRPIGEVTNGVYGRETAEKVHKRLRELGSITVPKEFVFMDRAALGLGSVFLHLKAEINWYQTFNSLIEGFDLQKLGAKQQQIITQFNI